MTHNQEVPKIPDRFSGYYWVNRHGHHVHDWEVAEYDDAELDWQFIGNDRSFLDHVALKSLIRRVGPRIPIFEGRPPTKTVPNARWDHKPRYGPTYVQQALSIGYSQKELASLCGVSEAHIGQLMSKEVEMSFAMQVLLEQIAGLR